MITDEDDIGRIRTILGMEGWRNVMKPKIEHRLRQKIKNLMLFPSERAEQDRNDEALRGAIQELEWMLVSWDNEIAVFEANRQTEELRLRQMNGTESLGSETPANP